MSNWNDRYSRENMRRQAAYASWPRECAAAHAAQDRARDQAGMDLADRLLAWKPESEQNT